jgi:glycosyltransferase involved in cell wall biosynthesis
MPAASAATLRYIAEDAPTGYGDWANRLVRALRDHGAEVEYLGWPNTVAGAAPVLSRFSRDERPRECVSADAPTVVHLVPEYYPLVRELVPYGRFIGHTVWEADRIPDHWPGLLNETDLVIVPTEWNRDVFVEGGVRVPVAVVPPVARVPVLRDGGAPLDIPDELIVFYAIGRWDQRKAMFHAVEAFLRAFTGDDPVVLVVKTGPKIEMPPTEEWGTDNPRAWTTGWQVARLVSRHRHPAQLRLEVGDWTDDQIAALHARGDCYVSLTRGEGWGMGAFDACAYGNPVVATGWGGALAFLDDEGASLVETRIIPVEHVYASYSPDQRWAEPNLDHAVELLRTVASDVAAARARAGPLQERVLRDYAPTVVAREFLKVLA